MKRHLIGPLLLVIMLVLAACGAGATSTPIAGTTSAPAVSIARPAVRALAVDPRDGHLLKASADGLYQSGDEGKTWTAVTLPAEIRSKGVAQVAIRRDAPDIVYIAGESVGIWRSRDAGKTWQKVTRGLTSEQVGALAVHSNGYPRDSRQTLFAWVAGVGMFESQDEGDNWKRSVDQGMGLDDKRVMALTHSPLEGSMNTGWLYAATPAGAFLSMD